MEVDSARTQTAPRGPTRSRRRHQAVCCRQPRAGRLKSVSRIAVLLALAGLGSGCASLRQWWQNGFKVGPNYVEPQAPVARQWIDAANPQISGAPANDCAWWTVFNDAALNGLIEAAQRQNLDLQVAGTRILESRAQRNVATGNLFPQSQTALGTYAHAQVTRNLGLPILPNTVNLWATGFNASWEADFWGRYRRTIEAADADLSASVEGYRDALVLLLSEVATNYVQLRTFDERLQYARKNVQIQRGSLGLAETRFNQGLATELDMRQARVNLAQTESLIPPLEAGRRQANNRLCILLGMPVGDLAGQLQSSAIPTAPIDVAVGIPADLLRRRPDIRRAEREVAAQSARIGVAEADLYPRFALNGFIGYAADDLKKLFSSQSFTAFIVPSLQWNVLNYGRIANNIRAQDARLQGAALQYQQAVLIAGREVEDALVGFLQAKQQAAHLEESVREAERSMELVIVQFQGGITDFNRVFNTQSVLVTQQDQLASTRGNIAINLIEVYRGLGGGWQYFAQGGGIPAGQPAAVSGQPAGGAEEIPPAAPAQ
jgi:NodT family efflux transporter outer membrane factor (OMF) lipoprotein